MSRLRKSASPLQNFNSSSEDIRLVVMICDRMPLRLRNVEDLLFERRIAGNVRFPPPFVYVPGDFTWNSKAARHAKVHNQLNLKCHLVDRTTYQASRSASLAE